MRLLSVTAAGIILFLSNSYASAEDFCEEGVLTQVGVISKDQVWGNGQQRIRIKLRDNPHDYFSYNTLDDPATRAMFAIATNAYNSGHTIFIAGSHCAERRFTQLTAYFK